MIREFIYEDREEGRAKDGTLIGGHQLKGSQEKSDGGQPE